MKGASESESEQQILVKYGARIKAVGRSEEEAEEDWSGCSEYGAAALLLEGVVARRVQQRVFALSLLTVANELSYEMITQRKWKD